MSDGTDRPDRHAGRNASRNERAAQLFAAFLAAVLLLFAFAGHHDQAQNRPGLAGRGTVSAARLESLARRVLTLLPPAQEPVRKAQAQPPQPPKFAGTDGGPPFPPPAGIFPLPDDLGASVMARAIPLLSPHPWSPHRARAPPPILFLS